MQLLNKCNIALHRCSATSATSHVVLGQFKTCVILLGGYLIFNSDPGIVSILGAVVALCGMTVYTLLSVKESREKQTLPSVKPKSTEDEGDETKKLLPDVNDASSQSSTTV